MKPLTVVFLSCLSGLAVVSGVASFAVDFSTRTRIGEYAALDQPKMTYEAECAPFPVSNNAMSPEDLYKAMAACVRQQNYKNATLLVALAGVNARYDVQRVSDRTAHKADNYLRSKAVAELSKPQQAMLSDAVQLEMNSPDNRSIICGAMERLGPPQYFPEYMLRYGMSSLVKSGGTSGLVPDFDSDTAWRIALNSYLYCAG